MYSIGYVQDEKSQILFALIDHKGIALQQLINHFYLKAILLTLRFRLDYWFAQAYWLQ